MLCHYRLLTFLKKRLIDGVILNHPVNMNHKTLIINTFLFHKVDNSDFFCLVFLYEYKGGSVTKAKRYTSLEIDYIFHTFFTHFSHIGSIVVKFVLVNMRQQQQKGNQNGSKNQSHKTKKLYSNDNPKNCDKGVCVANFILHPKPKQIIHRADNE